MDTFHQNARELKVREAFVVGAIYGIWLTIGTAWSQFIDALVFVVVPDNEDIVLREFIHVCIASLMGLGILALIVKCNMCVTQVTRRVKHRIVRAEETVPHPVITQATHQTNGRQVHGMSKKNVRPLK